MRRILDFRKPRDRDPRCPAVGRRLGNRWITRRAEAGPGPTRRTGAGRWISAAGPVPASARRPAGACPGRADAGRGRSRSVRACRAPGLSVPAGAGPPDYLPGVPSPCCAPGPWWAPRWPPGPGKTPASTALVMASACSWVSLPSLTACSRRSLSAACRSSADGPLRPVGRPVLLADLLQCGCHLVGGHAQLLGERLGELALPVGLRAGAGPEPGRCWRSMSAWNCRRRTRSSGPRSRRRGRRRWPGRPAGASCGWCGTCCPPEVRSSCAVVTDSDRAVWAEAVATLSAS